MPEAAVSRLIDSRDEAVSPGATHSYTIYTVDQHFNFSTATTVNATTPAIVGVKK